MRSFAECRLAITVGLVGVCVICCENFVELDAADACTDAVCLLQTSASIRQASTRQTPDAVEERLDVESDSQEPRRTTLWMGRRRRSDEAVEDSNTTADAMTPIRQVLTNLGDAQYLAKISVGSQTLNGILDSGSFDLLVFAQRCLACGNTEKLYDRNSSSSYTSMSLTMEHEFGSGSTESIAALETVKMMGTDGKTLGLLSEGQAFWEVYDAQMEILSEATFQAIVGVGPPLSSVKMAEADLSDMRAELTDIQSQGNGATTQMKDYLHHFQKVVDFTKQSPSLLEKFGTQTFSVCLQPESGSEGFFIWNDNAHELQPTLFSNVQTNGDVYWSVDISHAALGARPDGDSEKTHLGCSEESSCSAVLDTGTSLIIVPKQVAEVVLKAVEDWKGDCADLSRLPNLEFNVGGQHMSLPPSSYIGEVHGDFMQWDLGTQSILAHMKEPLVLGDGKACVSLLLGEDVESEHGNLWVLGLPFFRRYYTSFHLTTHEVDSSEFARQGLDSSISSGRAVAKSVSFAAADEKCNPVGGQLMTRSSQDRLGPMRIDAAKLRVPAWLRRNRADELALAAKHSA